MGIRKFSVAELQPSDSLREESQNFFSRLSDSGLRKFRLPEVYEIKDDGLLLPVGTVIITEGNNRIYNMVYRGFDSISAIVKRVSASVFEDDIERAYQMRSSGILSPYDVVGVVNGAEGFYVEACGMVEHSHSYRKGKRSNTYRKFKSRNKKRC